MCMVSNIGDMFTDKWTQPKQPAYTFYRGGEISRKEFDDLKKEVELMKDLLLRAKKYDEETGQPDCEMEVKVEMLKKIAEQMGVSLDDVFKPQSPA